jgi:cytochrome c oxidase assembly factor 5
MSCNVIREALVSCLLKSDCVLRSEPARTPSDCLKDSAALPEECSHLRKAFFECKRGQVSFSSPSSAFTERRELM